MAAAAGNFAFVFEIHSAVRRDFGGRAAFARRQRPQLKLDGAQQLLAFDLKHQVEVRLVCKHMLQDHVAQRHGFIVRPPCPLGRRGVAIARGIVDFQGMRRVLLELEFHGKGFFGWQRQGPDRSVQGVVEAAVTDLVGHAVSVQSSGRTDRGVHARAMPAHVDVETRLGPRELMHALNHRLPEDVAVRRVREVDPRFHARFDARSKHYRYTYYRSRARSPLLADRACLMPRELDVSAMAEAALILTGTHDFASFQTRREGAAPDDDLPETTADTIGPAALAHGDFTPPPWRKPRPTGTVRTLSRVQLVEVNELLRIEVVGDGFLRGMVRAIAGTLVEIGLGSHPPSWAAELLDVKDRREAGANQPAHGLTLIKVEYPEAPFGSRQTPYVAD